MSTHAPSRAGVQARLTAARTEILGLGVSRLALFGSVRRDLARAGSDVNVAMNATLTRELLNSDPTIQRAIVPSLEIIGEASKRVPTEIRDANPQVE